MTGPVSNDWLDIAVWLEQLAERVRLSPPLSCEVGEKAAFRDVPPDESGNYHSRVRESAGPLETTITIRWQP